VLRAVLFDLDDTLLDHTGNQRRLAHLLRERHPAFADCDPDALASRSMAHLEELHPLIVAGALSSQDARLERFRRLLRESGANEADAEELAHWHRRTYLEVESLVPGAAELIAALCARNLKLAIISNSTRDEQQRKLATHGLAPFFDVLVVSGDHGIAKPDPGLFAIALRCLGVNAGEAVMVGDSWAADIAGARAAGIRAIWLNRFGHLAPDSWADAEIHAFDHTTCALVAGLFPPVEAGA
jgi:putative hydrolase of the HAD superfamily